MCVLYSGNKNLTKEIKIQFYSPRMQKSQKGRKEFNTIEYVMCLSVVVWHGVRVCVCVCVCMTIWPVSIAAGVGCFWCQILPESTVPL